MILLHEFCQDYGMVVSPENGGLPSPDRSLFLRPRSRCNCWCTADLAESAWSPTLHPTSVIKPSSTDPFPDELLTHKARPSSRAGQAWTRRWPTTPGSVIPQPSRRNTTQPAASAPSPLGPPKASSAASSHASSRQVSQSPRQSLRRFPAWAAFDWLIIERSILAVGTLLGAITGGLIGLASETGVVRGTWVGGITGVLVSMEVVDSSLAIWRSDEPAIWSVVYVLGVIWSLLTGRLVRENVDPAVLSAVETQMSAVESLARQGDGADIFETGGTSGMTRAAIDVLPAAKFTERGNVDASGELIACSVCLQEFEAGESARTLPVCRHTFHLPCIDGWLLRDASCPLCRRAV
ncbi:NEP1-interacting protein-like 1 isoform X1 [Phragmites australis]|uniref:NEP1-interacting protein-like 1 isoform X1 n=1 Tax=Phragmites australis TaxID=29695 RepID=UPI002D79ADB0|nr:NEP1-interacting protein-like 1 isoform X1 [Phragmites australis]